jgi:hypothetical protein
MNYRRLPNLAASNFSHFIQNRILMGTAWITDGWRLAVPAAAFLAWLCLHIQRWVYNIYFHPLARFPGPKIGAATTLWKAFIECILQRSFRDVLAELHEQYGTHASRQASKLRRHRP